MLLELAWGPCTDKAHVRIWKTENVLSASHVPNILASPHGTLESQPPDPDVNHLRGQTLHFWAPVAKYRSIGEESSCVQVCHAPPTKFPELIHPPLHLAHPVMPFLSFTSEMPAHLSVPRSEWGLPELGQPPRFHSEF